MLSSEEEEEFLVHVEFDGVLEKGVLDRSPVFFKVIGIEGRRPVILIGNQTFAGNTMTLWEQFFSSRRIRHLLEVSRSSQPSHNINYVTFARLAKHYVWQEYF
jgi:hypothetical protein